jgi:hypothetical protein
LYLSNSPSRFHLLSVFPYISLSLSLSLSLLALLLSTIKFIILPIQFSLPIILCVSLLQSPLSLPLFIHFYYCSRVADRGTASSGG